MSINSKTRLFPTNLFLSRDLGKRITKAFEYSRTDFVEVIESSIWTFEAICPSCHCEFNEAISLD